MKLRVLLVIDDDGVAQAIESVVRDEGDEVERATDIEAAVVAATARPADVAFVELSSEGGAAMALCHQSCPAWSRAKGMGARLKYKASWRLFNTTFTTFGLLKSCAECTKCAAVAAGTGF